MSHVAKIDYEALSATARITCEEALKQLCIIDKILDKIIASSSSLLTNRIKSYKEYLLKTKDSLSEKINELIKLSMQNRDQNIVNKAMDLQQEVNTLQYDRLMLIERMIDEELVKNIEQIKYEQENERLGRVDIDQEMIKKLLTIKDEFLREEVYRALLEKKNKGIPFQLLIKQVESALSEKNVDTVMSKKDEILNQISEDMRSNDIAEDVISNTIDKNIKSIEDIKKMNEVSKRVIVDERVRQESIKAIVKTIRKRGFIINKDQIKIDKEKNEVRIWSKKASGERAEFRVYLDGKFIYKFDGYEGQACQEDLAPFFSDLENIYNIKVKEKIEIWSNPDKNSTMKYQIMDKNKGTN